MKVYQKIIAKLHMQGLVYALEKCFKRSHNIEMPANKALAYLYNVFPDNGNSCIISRQWQSFDCDLEIIVPCYNVQQYVEECLDSILSQATNYSFFVTIVNDGSKDNTRKILQKYEKIENVRIIDQKNMGLSGARNTAIAQAHGRYLLFVDSDDLLLPGAIEMYMTLAHKVDADVVDSGHIRFADRHTKGVKAKIQADIYDALQRPQTLALNLDSPTITGYPCGKVFKTELFHKVQFPLGYWFEDTLVWMILEPMCKRKVTSDKLTFRYRMNPNSISHRASFNPKALDSLYITLQLLKDRESLGIEFDQYQYDLLLKQMRMNFYRVACLDSKIKQAVFAVEHNLIANKFAGWSTGDRYLKKIEELLRSGDYVGFELWCKWH